MAIYAEITSTEDGHYGHVINTDPIAHDVCEPIGPTTADEAKNWTTRVLALIA